jgi:hypothetical protein
MCTVLLPTGAKPFAVKCIISYNIISYHIVPYHISYHHIISLFSLLVINEESATDLTASINQFQSNLNVVKSLG